MAHEIKQTDKLVYAVEKPWHGIGTRVDEVLTASEAITLAGLDWPVWEAPVFDRLGNEISGYKLIRRSDTKEVFQIASDAYRIVQNVDCFKIVDEIVGTGLAKYDVAGTLRGGRVVFLTVRLPYDFSLYGGKDEVKTYLNFISSHDSSFALQAMESPIRTVCMNTVRAAIASAEVKVYAKHTMHSVSNLKDRAIRTLERTRAWFAAYKQHAENLAAKQMKALEIDSFLDQLFNIDREKEVSTRQENIVEEVKRLHEVGRGTDIPGVRGTAWGIYNAVAEYVDYERSTKGGEDNRVFSSWLGSGAQLREKAFALLTR